MQLVILPRYNQYKCFDFYYSNSVFETFNMSDDFVYSFYVGDGIVDIRKFEIELFYVYIYFKIQNIRGKNQTHNHYHYPYYNLNGHRELSNNITIEIDKIENNMLCKKPKRLYDLSTEVY